MLSFGSAAFTADGELVATHAANLDLLDGAAGHPETMAWWGNCNMLREHRAGSRR
jgi:hypothetical protein